MKRLFGKIIGGVIVIMLLFQFNGIVLADEIKDLQNKQSDNSEKIDEAKQQKQQVSQEKNETQKQVDNLNNQISDYESQIGDLDLKITNLNTQIEDSQNKITQKQEDYKKEKELLEKRLVATYEAGETSYLDVLLSSESLTDFISTYYYVSEIAKNDLELMEKIKKEEEEIKTAKETLETSKKELSDSKSKKESMSVQLQTAKNEKSKYVAQLSKEEQDIQEEIDQLTRDNQKILNDIKVAQAKYQKQLEELKKQEENKKPSTGSGSSSNNKPSNGGTSSNKPSGGGSTGSGSSGGSSSSGSGYFIRPVKGGTITANGYYPSSGKFHGAIDYGVNSGTPVYAAAAGVVLSVQNLSGSYGTHVVIEHANGLHTWYAHGTPGSVSVSPGQIVSQGQTIMKSGNSGNSGGPHLHFEVRKPYYNYSYSAKKYGDDLRVDPNKYF